MKSSQQFFVLALGMLWIAVPSAAQKPVLTIEKDLTIYRDERFYAAFPSVVRRESGELIVAFRRAPDRRVFGEGGNNHTDTNSYLMLVRSTDNGETWTESPELILAHPFGGSQDPCMIQLNDQSILCSSYGWARVDVTPDNNGTATLFSFAYEEMPDTPIVAGRVPEPSGLGLLAAGGGALALAARRRRRQQKS